MPFVVLSSDLAELTPVGNAKLYDAMAMTLLRFFPETMPSIGMYKGKLEKSFVVPVADEDEYEHLRELAKEFRQESILLVDDDLSANLVMLKDGEITELGYWSLYGVLQPENQEAWTLVGNAYFVCV